MKVILDTDPGIDDALAILLLAASPEIELLAITVTHGNTSVEKCATNALALADLLHLEIPIASGAHAPLVKALTVAEETHGDGGLGYATLPPSGRSLHPKHAVDLLIELIHAHPNEITLLCIGPVTNFALAIRRDPSIIPLIKQIVVMGGAINYPGNMTPSAEYNVFCDPHAFDLLLKSGVDLIIIPLDVTYQCLWQKSHVERLTSTPKAIHDFIDDSTRFYMEFHSEYQNIEGCAINDPLAAAILVRPDLVEMQEYFVTVELRGEHTTAKTSADQFNATGNPPNAKVAMKVNVEDFMDFFIERMNSL